MQASMTSTLVEQVSRLVDHTGYGLPAALLLFVFLLLKYPNRAIGHPAKRPGVHEEPGWPLVGHTPAVLYHGTHRQHERVLEFLKKSPNSALRLSVVGMPSTVILSRPEYIEAIQKLHLDRFPKGQRFMKNFQELLGTNGIFVADGQVWHTQRKMASKIFSANQFRSWVQAVVHSELETSLAILEDTTSAKGTKKLVMPELFFRYTLSSFAKMAFSRDIGCLEPNAASLDKKVPFGTAFDHAQGVCNDRFMLPFWEIFEAISPKGRKMKESVRVIRSFGLEIITERLALRQSGNEKAKKGEKKNDVQLLEKDGKDLLDLFMDLTMDQEELLIIVLNFLIAGRDTTAQALSWLFYELMRHPEVVEKIRAEVQEKLGDNPAPLLYDQVKELPYLQACISEALRLHPPVPKNGKICAQDTLLVPQGANPHNLPPIQIYKGEQVGWSDWAMGRLPEVWGEDAEEFNPMRFIKVEKGREGEKDMLSYINHSQWQFHVFNGGPRICLGMGLAFYEALAFCSSVIPRYDFAWATKEQGQQASWPLQYLNSVTHPSEMYLCTVKKHA